MLPYLSTRVLLNTKQAKAIAGLVDVHGAVEIEQQREQRQR